MGSVSMVCASVMLATGPATAPLHLGNALMIAADMADVSMALVYASPATRVKVAQSESCLRSAPTIAWESEFARRGCVSVRLVTKERIVAYVHVRMIVVDTGSATMARATASPVGVALCVVMWYVQPIAP
jgi:hypothetical protein